MIFWNILSLLIVGFVVVLHARHMTQFFKLYRQYARVTQRPHPRESFSDLMDFARAYYEFSPDLEMKVRKIKDTFFREAATAFLHGGVVGNDLVNALNLKADKKFESEVAAIHDLHFHMRSLPAVGWAVAVGASIWMFNSGDAAISLERAGLAFAITMGAVFYGLFVTYVFSMPLMEKIWRAAHEERQKNALLAEGLAQVMRKKNPFELYEGMQMLIPEKNLPQWREVFSNQLKQAG